MYNNSPNNMPVPTFHILTFVSTMANVRKYEKPFRYIIATSIIITTSTINYMYNCLFFTKI